jgi:uncharacterized protein
MSWRILRALEAPGSQRRCLSRLSGHHRQHFDVSLQLQRERHLRYRPLSTLSTVIFPPVVFTGLVLTLWTYKCMMMIIFQNKIIYMPGVPLGARDERIEDYTKQCRPVVWNKEILETSDRKKIAVAVANSEPDGEEINAHVIVLYFQG